jgi:Glycoside Hydrolase Family 113
VAHALGLKVALKPHVDPEDGGARAWLLPRDPARWFSTYDAKMLDYARLARGEHCELFVVGTELSLLTLPPYWRDWRALIRRVRAVYPGPLTYAGNWHSELHVGFWKDLDDIGVDAYYPIPGGTDGTLLRLAWKAPEAELRALSAVEGRPVLFTEFGLASQKGADLRPWDWRRFGPVDDAVQAAYLRSFLATFAGKPWVAGFLEWAWDEGPGGPGDATMSVRGKPALGVLEGFYRAARVPPAPSHAPAAARARRVLEDAAALSR